MPEFGGMKEKPLAIDLCCGLGGWAEGFLAEGWDIIGFDVESLPYPGVFCLQDVRTIDGARLRAADLIVASPPCTQFSRLGQPGIFPNEPEPDTSLVAACWRIAREARLPIVLENVNGAQPYIGRAPMRYGSRYLWGTGLPALLPAETPPPKRICDAGHKDRARGRAKIPLALAVAVARANDPRRST